MNNDDLTKVPVSQLTTADKEKLIGPHVEKKKQQQRERKLQKGLIIAIVSVAAVIGLGIGLFFVLRKAPEDTPVAEGETTSITLEPVEMSAESVSEDAFKPDASYISEVEAKLASPELDAGERVMTELELANLQMRAKDFTAAEAQLDAINRESLAPYQLYNLYQSYVQLYEYTGNEVKHEEYAALLDEVKKQI